MAENYNSCSTHCCKNHGCKYGHSDCPVAKGRVVQEYLCEQCQTQGYYSEVSYGPTEMVVGVNVSLVTADADLSNLPTEEAVIDAVRAALLGLGVGSWNVNTVHNG